MKPKTNTGNILLFLTFLIATSSCWAQSSMYSNDTTIADLNQDGVIDTLFDEWHYGWGRQLTYFDGKAQRPYTMNDVADFSNFFELIEIPNDLYEQKVLLDTLKSRFYGERSPTPMSVPVQWVENAHQNTRNFKKNEGSLIKSHTQNILQWHPTPIDTPQHGYTLINCEKTDLIYPGLTHSPAKYAWLTYRGHIHQMSWKRDPIQLFERLDSNQFGTLVGTRHGLLLEKGGKYTWIFHSTKYLTRTPSKLRWASIDSVLMMDELVFVKHATPVYDGHGLFVIDIDKGNMIWVDLKEWFSDDNYYDMCFNMRKNGDELELNWWECKEPEGEPVYRTVLLDLRVVKAILNDPQKARQ